MFCVFRSFVSERRQPTLFRFLFCFVLFWQRHHWHWLTTQDDLTDQHQTVLVLSIGEEWSKGSKCKWELLSIHASDVYCAMKCRQNKTKKLQRVCLVKNQNCFWKRNVVHALLTLLLGIWEHNGGKGGGEISINGATRYIRVTWTRNESYAVIKWQLLNLQTPWQCEVVAEIELTLCQNGQTTTYIAAKVSKQRETATHKNIPKLKSWISIHRPSKF